MSDNDIAMERWEAQGSSQEPARPGTPTPLETLGSRKLGVMTPASLAGEGSLASSLAPPSAPFPRKREKENGIRAIPGCPKQKPRAAKRWLRRLFEN